MKIALIYPFSIVGEEYSLRNKLMDDLKGIISFFADTQDYRERYPSLALLTVASLLPEEWNIEFIDETIYGLGYSEKKIVEEKYDIIFLSVLNSQAKRALELSKFALKHKIISVCGGYYPSVLYEELKDKFSTIVVGEAEDTIPEFLKDLKKNNIKSIYKSSGNNPPDSFPKPRYDLVKFKEKYDYIPIQATRGCCYNCSFCTIMNIFGRKFRTKKLSSLILEIEEIKKLFGRKIISFVDENLFIDRKYSKKMCEALIPLNIKWECYSDISVGNDEELLKLLYKSGCRQIQIGLESINQKTLKEISKFKASCLPKYKEYIENIQRNGIQVIGMFIIGFDDDNWNTIMELDNFIRESHMFNFIVEWLTPVPGTQIFEKLKNENRLKKGDWEKEEKISFLPRNISEIEMEYGTIWLSYQFSKKERLLERQKYFKEIMRNLFQQNI